MTNESMTMIGKAGVLWRFVGKMTCRQVLILMFLAIGAISIAIWSLSSKHGIRSSTASKIPSFGGGKGVSRTVIALEGGTTWLGM